MNNKQKLHIFYEQFTTTTYGCSAECYCGIFHYDIANQWDNEYNDIELPQALENAKEFPNNYQFQDNSIEYINLNDSLYVIGCRCQMDLFIFNFLNECKEDIVNYYINTRDNTKLENL